MVPTVELKQKKMILLKETSTGRGSDGKVYGAMGRARERWGGVWGDGQGAGAVGRYMG